MVASPLVEPTISDAARLLDELDRAGVPITSALWLYKPEADLWHLVLATPWTDEFGSLETYKRIQQVVRDNPHDIRLPDISVIAPEAPLIKALRSLIVGEPAGVRLGGTAREGVYIDDAYIYRMT